jgi:GntR family transcriptional regulator, transcriptional repressor for pyruvate dehydrogenase complex
MDNMGIARQSLSVQIFHRIKELILSQKIPVGQSLPSERTLAKQFVVSRSVIREALKSLEQSGLVEIRLGTNGGAFVADNFHLPLFSSAYDMSKTGMLTIDHFYEARRANECTSVREACMKATAEDLEHLRQINARLLNDQDDRLKTREDNRAFHLAIADIADNPLIRLIIHSLLLLTDTLCQGSGRRQALVKEMHKRHEAIIQALESRDVVLCEYLMTMETLATKELNLPREAVFDSGPQNKRNGQL